MASAGLHEPAPSHTSELQVAGLAVHALCGSSPESTALHCPTEPARLHALQPLHCVSQHTPSAQLPNAHWEPTTQAVPLANFGTQLVPLSQ